jgi:hypothetical protein
MDPTIDARMRTQRILFGALLFSNAMFAVVSLNAPPHAPPEDPVMLIALVCVSVAVLVVSFVLPATFERKGLESMPAELTSSADPNQPSSFAKHSGAKAFANPRKALADALARTMTPFILRMALREAVGIYGLMLVFLGYPMHYGFAFMAVSFLAQSIEFPRLSRVADALEKAKGASLGPR